MAWESPDKIILINDKIYGPSVGIYVRSITEFLGTDKNLYTYIYDKKNLPLKIEGNKLRGVYPPMSSGWFFNTTFQNIIYRKFKNLVKSKSENVLIHYTSQQIKPFNFGHPTVTVHDLVPVLFPEQSHKRIVKMTKRNLDFYKKLPIASTISNFTRKSMEDYGFDGKIHVVPNTISKTFRPLNVEKSDLRRKLNLPGEKKLILSVSANYPRKNLQLVEQTVNSLGDSYVLVRVGPPVGNSINFSNVSEETLNEIYNACDVFFMPSSYEGFGMPVLEAMSSGIPVVASDIEIFEEVAGNAALLTSIEIGDFKRAIKEASINGEEFGQLGLEQTKKYSFQNFSGRLNEFYLDALNVYGL